MIKISGKAAAFEDIVSQNSISDTGRIIIDKLSSSSAVYSFASIKELKFELDLRDNIIKAARELHKSKLSFRLFRNSMCSTDYWKRTNEGGFSAREDVKPSQAVKDIFINGHKYGTECATAIVIIYYKAAVDMLPEEQFNDLFSYIYLMNWKSIDKDLGVKYYDYVADFLPGDCRYFRNPDVDPLTPEWQGENAIDFGDGTYYGHGIGITNAEGVIKALNMHRKSGSVESAYLLNSATRLTLSV